VAVLKTAGLSLQQAPPIQIPLGLFLTAPVFLLFAALILASQGEGILASRWSPAALAVTHLIAVGFLGQIMCGVLLQMLPVIAGAPVPAVALVGLAVNLLLAAGAGMLGWGFLTGGQAMLVAGAVCASLGFMTFLVAASLALGQANGVARTIRGIRFALASLLVTITMGLLLIGALNGWIALPGLPDLVDVHLAWGLLGWVGLLITGVAFEVVRMFYVTPTYPAWLARWLAPVVVFALALGSLLAMNDARRGAFAAYAVAVAGFALFAAGTLWLQLRRERKRVDATLLHWWAAMACAIAAGICWVTGGSPVLVGILLLLGVGVGLPFGMLFKIVPFLVWFHLQHRQLESGRLGVRVPHMLTFLPDKWARLQFAVYMGALSCLIGAWLTPAFSYLASVVLGLAAIGLGALVMVSIVRFRRVALALESPNG